MLWQLLEHIDEIILIIFIGNRNDCEILETPILKFDFTNNKTSSVSLANKQKQKSIYAILKVELS